MSIGILYIAIGRYASFFEDFYKSCELHLFPGTKKNYYVYSDVIDGTNYADVKVIKATDHGWPGNTLMRFDMFADSQTEWQDNDYMLFLNGNTLLVEDILIDDFFPYDDIETVTARIDSFHSLFDGRKILSGRTLRSPNGSIHTIGQSVPQTNSERQRQ